MCHSVTTCMTGHVLPAQWCPEAIEHGGNLARRAALGSRRGRRPRHPHSCRHDVGLSARCGRPAHCAVNHPVARWLRAGFVGGTSTNSASISVRTRRFLSRASLPRSCHIRGRSSATAGRSATYRCGCGDGVQSRAAARPDAVRRGSSARCAWDCRSACGKCGADGSGCDHGEDPVCNGQFEGSRASPASCARRRMRRHRSDSWQAYVSCCIPAASTLRCDRRGYTPRPGGWLACSGTTVTPHADRPRRAAVGRSSGALLPAKITLQHLRRAACGYVDGHAGARASGESAPPVHTRHACAHEGPAACRGAR